MRPLKKIFSQAQEAKKTMLDNLSEGELQFKDLLSAAPRDGMVYLRRGEAYKEWWQKTNSPEYKEKMLKDFRQAFKYFQQVPSYVKSRKFYIDTALAYLKESQSDISSVIVADRIQQPMLGEDLQAVVKAVADEQERIEKIENRPRYFVFGKTGEYFEEQTHYVTFRNFPERFYLAAKEGGQLDFRVGTSFLKGRIEKIDTDEAIISFPRECLTEENIQTDMENGIYYIMDSRDLLKILRNFLIQQTYESPFLPQIIRGQNPIPLTQDHIAVPEQLKLNPVQKEAVEKALTQSVTYIWGPPGTGKTKTLAAIAHVLFHEKQSVLLASLSNMSVDHLLHSFVKTTKHENQPLEEFVVRLGKPRDSTPEDIRKFHNHMNDKTQIVAGNFFNILMPNNALGKFDYVIADEVSMTPVPLLAAASYFAGKGLILAGDPNQLPPPYPEDAKSPGEWFTQNVFEKTSIRIENDPRAVFLNLQYRMNKEISDLVSELFYDGKLRCGKEDSSPLELHGPAGKRVLPKSALFLNSAGAVEKIGYRDETDFRRNELHASAIAALVRRFVRECEISPADIGIIAPYNAQVCTIVRHLRRNGLEQVKVSR